MFNPLALMGGFTPPRVTSTALNNEDKNLQQYRQFVEGMGAPLPIPNIMQNMADPRVPVATQQVNDINTLIESRRAMADRFDGYKGALYERDQNSPFGMPQFSPMGIPAPEGNKTTVQPMSERRAPQQYQGQFPTPQSRASSSVPQGSGGASGILNNAYKYKGVPYKWGGTTPSGFDCSGFTQYVSRESGYNIPRTAAAQYNYFQKSGKLFNDLSQAQPGDLLYFASRGSPSGWHTGIYVGGGKMIHAPGTGSAVKVANIGNRTLRGIGRM